MCDIYVCVCCVVFVMVFNVSMCVGYCVSQCVRAFSTSQTRLPSDISDEVDEDPSGSRAIWDRGLLNGATQKVRGETFDVESVDTTPD